MAGSATITGRQNYVMGIGHPATEATTEAPPAMLSTNSTGKVNGIALPDGGVYGLDQPLIKNAIALIGDSRMAQYHIDTTPIIGSPGVWKNSVHFLTWAQAQSGQRFNVIYDGGVSGFRSDQYLAYLQPAIESGANFLMIWGCVNDIAAGCTPTQIWTGVGMPTASIGILKAVLAATAAGMKVILVGEPGQVGMSSTRMGYVMQYNQLCRELTESAPNVYYFDAPSVLLDPTQTTVAFKSGYSSDGTHTIAQGAAALGSAFSTFINTLIPPQGQQIQAAWDVGVNGGSNILMNPLFLTGTGGTAGTNVTGAVPANWAVNGSANVAVTSSVAAGTYGNDWTLALTASAAGQAQGYFFLLPGGNGGNYGALAAGQIYQAGVEYDVSSNTNFCPPSLNQLIQLDGANNQPGDMSSSSSQGAGPTTAYTNVLQSPKFTIPAFTTGNQWYWYFTMNFTGAGSATVKIRRPWLRKRIA